MTETPQLLYTTPAALHNYKNTQKTFITKKKQNQRSPGTCGKTSSHLHSLLRRLIWSVTKLCSKKEMSGLLMAPSPGSFEEANSITQLTNARVKRKSLSASVWACCEWSTLNSMNTETGCTVLCFSPTLVSTSISVSSGSAGGWNTRL